MTAEEDFSVDSARGAADAGQLAHWVVRFLASPGSDNPALGEALCQGLGWWTGPLRVPLAKLHRLAGPPGEPVLCPVDEEYWDERVDLMEHLAEGGWQPPPVIAAYRENRLVLEDGNHRVESLRRAGRRDVGGGRIRASGRSGALRRAVEPGCCVRRRSTGNGLAPCPYGVLGLPRRVAR